MVGEIVHDGVLTHAAARRLARRLGPSHIVELRWPNALGERPEDALGKHVYLEMPVGRGEFEVRSIADGKLVLRPFP
jgi:hypothetical protein